MRITWEAAALEFFRISAFKDNIDIVNAESSKMWSSLGATRYISSVYAADSDGGIRIKR